MNKISQNTASVQFVEITDNQNGQRLDNFLLKCLKNLPKSRLYRIIRKGEVRVNKKRVKPEYKLQVGDSLRIPPIRLQTDESKPMVIPDSLVEKLSQSILYENEDIVVLNKPSGLAVHSGSGLRFGVIDIMRQLKSNDIELVHRLDRDTSGCLLLAKNRAALVTMQRFLQSNKMVKTYCAVVRGHWDKSLLMVELPLLKQTMPNGERKVFIDDRGQVAKTQIVDVQLFSKNMVDYSYLKIKLLTGRTHQIRVHCQSQQHQIAGDEKYGDRQFNKLMKQQFKSKRLLLHAISLEIPEFGHTKDLKITAPEPIEIASLLNI